MMLEPEFVGDVADLPSHAFGHRSLTWWGIIGFMAIEGTAFALAIGVYFYLMSREASWPPEPYPPPDFLAGTLFTILILASEWPNTLLKRAAEQEDIGRVRILLPIMAAVGIPLLLIRVFEFNSLHVRWTDNAYGSVMWMLLVLHTTHVLTDWFDTIVLTALMFTSHGESGRRFVDVSENSLYWRFVWISWLPIYLILYWLPRWVA